MLTRQTKEELEEELEALARDDLMRRRVALANPANRVLQVVMHAFTVNFH